MNETPAAPAARPGWFWIVAIAALLWNLVGLSIFALHYSMGPEELAALPEGQRRMLENVPAWAWISYAVAVVAGTVASIALLLRRRYAVALYWISLVGVVLLQVVWTMFLSGAPAILGPGSLVMPVLVLVIAVVLVLFSRHAARRGWIA
jgi:hypothetical protein